MYMSSEAKGITKTRSRIFVLDGDSVGGPSSKAKYSLLTDSEPVP